MAIRKMPGSNNDKNKEEPLPSSNETQQENSPAPNLFSNITYALPDGRYEAHIETATSGQSNWIVSYALADGTVFKEWVPVPFRRDFGMGQALYSVKDQLPKDFCARNLIGMPVRFDICNVEKNGRAYSNIHNMELLSDDEYDN